MINIIAHNQQMTKKLISVGTIFLIVSAANICLSQKINPPDRVSTWAFNQQQDENTNSNSNLVLQNDKLPVVHETESSQTITSNDEVANMTQNTPNEKLKSNAQLKSPLATTVATSKTIYDEESLRDCEDVLYNTDSSGRGLTVSQFGRMALTLKMYAAFYSDIFIHRYDNFNEVKLSGGPETDQELCLKNLNELLVRSNRIREEGFESKDLNMFRLVDTFGRPPPGLLLGNVLWTGQYHECLKLKINTQDGQELPTRYCFASLKHKIWPQKSELDEFMTLKGGVCLPKSCDSMSYKNKYELVLKLFETNANPYERNISTLDSLYCLPDPNSSLTIWWHSPKTVAFVVVVSSWLVVLVFSTIRCNQLEKQQEEEKRRISAENEANEGEEELSFSLSKGFENKTESGRDSEVSAITKDDYHSRRAKVLQKLDQEEVSRRKFQNLKLYQALSITHNLSCLFNTSKASSLMETGEKLNSSSKASAANCDEDKIRSDKLVENENKLSPKQPVAAAAVDLRCIEGIKVIAMSYIVMGHVLMCLTIVLENGREAAYSTSVTYAITNMMPAFAVNAFFTITGLLTAYLMFKQNQSYSFITSPVKWFAFIMYRYLRIMPLYLIIALYSKHLAKYTGSGPFWDYGTSSLAARKTCEQESLWWTLLFGANFKSPLDHCIPSAWYLANDFQFFIVTPIFLALLHKNPKLGVRILKVCTIIGFIANFINIYNSPLDDFRPIAQFMPHGFKTYVSHLNDNYVRPQYRIPSYLIGLLIGFSLHNFEQDSLKCLAKKKSTTPIKANGIGDTNNNSNKSDDHSASNEGTAELSDDVRSGYSCDRDEHPVEMPTWSDGFKKWGLTLAVLGVSVGFLVPSIAFRIAMGTYILLATTGHGNVQLNKFLSSPLWKPLARLSLCAVLINVEVISYLTQTKTHTEYLDNQFQASLSMISVVTTYLVSVVVCVLFEAPTRAILNHILAHATSKIAKNNKRKKIQ